MKPLRILVVDDDAASSGRTNRILSAARYEVSHCAEYPVALRMLKTLKGRTIVVGAMKSSGGAGLGFLVEALRNYEFLPVILFSPRPAVDDVTAALRAGAHDFLKKPLQPEALLESVARATHRLDLAIECERNERETRAEISAMRSELKSARAQAAFKGFMISMAAHDFRSVLTVLDGYQQIIRQNCDNRCRNEITPTMIEQTNRTIFRLQSMANTLFDVEAAEKGELRIVPVPFDYDVLIRESASFYRPYAAQKRVDLDVEHPLPGMRALGDPARVLQIFDNLLYNAIKFTPADGTIRLGGDTGEKGFVTARITDTGSGLSKSLIKELLDEEPCGVRKDSTGRVGMGLSICKRLVANQNGRFGLSSRPGAGTTVSISLPSAE